jgi:hypothetical protein
MIKSLFKRIIIIVIITSVVLFVSYVMLKYNVEGEKNLPFSIDKILIVSTVDGQANDDPENYWNIDIEQVNDAYIYIDKTIEEEQTIQEIKLENFNLVQSPSKGKIKLLRPTGDIDNLYKYSQDDCFDKGITYVGGKLDDLKSLEISNDGGVLGFRLSICDLGKFVSNEVDNIAYDGTLLSGLGLNIDDIKFSVSFDIIITTSENISFKGTINLDLPLENTIEDGTANREITEFNNIVFKRI